MNQREINKDSNRNVCRFAVKFSWIQKLYIYIYVYIWTIFEREREQKAWPVYLSLSDIITPRFSFQGREEEEEEIG